MNIYQSLGNNVGTPEAAELSERLAAWHDAMVSHERVSRNRLACDEDCPHSEATRLWEEAVRTFGDGAHELRFLRSCGTAARAATGRGTRAPREARA
jgi:hypothetical protein